MPKRSKMELEGLVDKAYALFQYEKMTVEEVTKELKNDGYLVSRSGVARAIRKKKLDMRRFDEAMESAQAIVKATEGRPGTDIGEATLQLTLTKLLDELKCIQDFRDMSSEKIILAVAKVSRAIAAVSRLKLDYEKGYKAGLFKMRSTAADEAEKAALKMGGDKKLAAFIRNELLRLGDGTI